MIPTDCIAAALKAALPDATHLALGFDSRSGFSPGTAKTSVEGLALGGKVRKDGRIISVPLAYKTRRIDFGDGEKLAVCQGDAIVPRHSDSPILSGMIQEKRWSPTMWFCTGPHRRPSRR